ncbi:MAG TPA: hypothetical protein VJ370_17975, partial [Streptosporangiaceae bacterium]|nr:hypothetical protein [Streptosporangiaceae bacterium]
MHTPSEDESGTTPLAVAWARAGAGNPIPGASAESAQDAGSGADESNGSNASNGHGRALEQANRPQVEGPQLNGPQLNGPQLNGPQLNGPQLTEPQLDGPRLKRSRFTWPRLSGPWLRRAILVAWPVGLAVAGVALYLCYLAISRTEEVTSDGAS